MWLLNPNYVEIAIYFYANGSFAIHKHPEATANKTSFTVQIGSDGNWYYTTTGNTSMVTGIAHTHRYSSNPTQPGYDKDGVWQLNDMFVTPSTVTRYIYYNGSFHSY